MVILLCFFFKVIEPAIINALALVINQVLNTGIFPDKLKIAKVIQICKKDGPTLFKTDQSLYYQRYQSY